METVTQAETVTKLTLLPKPLDDYTDEELLALFDNTIRPARGKATGRKKAAAGTPGVTTTKSKTKPNTNSLDDLDI